MSIRLSGTGKVWAVVCHKALLVSAMACACSSALLDVMDTDSATLSTHDTRFNDNGQEKPEKFAEKSEPENDRTQDSEIDDVGTSGNTNDNREACISSDHQTDWQQLFPAMDETPDLGDAKVRLYIPCEVEQASGIMIFSHIGVGEWEYDHETWRASAAVQNYALVMIELADIHGRVAPWEFPEQSADFVTQILSAMADKSGHDELKTCPLFFFGHSAGGFWFTRMIPWLSERTAGFLAFHGSLSSNALFLADSLAVPGLFLIAEYDPIWIREDTTVIVEKGRKSGARWSLMVEPGAGHWEVDSGRQLMVDFTETVFQLRINQRNDGQEKSLPLMELPQSDGWLGQLEHQSVYGEGEEFDGSGKEVIVSADIMPWNEALSNNGNWLISEAFAKSWLAYERFGIY